MSTLLADSHTLLWFLAGDSALSGRARDTIEDPVNVVLVSAASIWEMAIKSSLGKLELPEDLLDEIETQGFSTLPVEPEHAWAVAHLPLVPDHKDPFDRQLVAQALVEDLAVISCDDRLDQYGVRRIW